MTPERIRGHVIVDSNGCWIWKGGKNPRGYGNVRWTGTTKTAHRVSWEAHHGPIPKGLNVLHKCDVRACVNPEHLWLGTHQDNMTDMSRKGRVVCRPHRGEEHYNAKLTEADIVTIRSLKLKLKEVAAMFDISEASVSLIRRRLHWKHVA